MTDRDLILVGPYPPPLGGVSAHIARLAQGVRDHGLTVGVVNHFTGAEEDPVVLAELGRNPWRYCRVLPSVRGRIVHYHHSRWDTLIATAWALRHASAATVATVHGRELEPYLSSRIPGVRRLTGRALRSFDALIAVSAEVRASLVPVAARPVALVPAYLPDTDETSALSAGAEAFVAAGTPLLMSGYRLSVDGQGRSIYGLEVAVDAFVRLARARPELRLAVFLAWPPRSGREASLLDGVLARAGADLRPRIGVFYGEPLAPALRRAAVYLRPTLTDGDAVSIREALAAGVPVLASDVVARPSGVRVLALDGAVWAAEIARTLDGERRGRGGWGGRRVAPSSDGLERLLDIYAALRPPRRVSSAAPVA